ncbi:hypothetical protein [Mycobacteroides abscessus]|uniref:hypothetical protein n=1 Tax=Mycobacteroides abscessus TaxID=36809 RepID=UPI0009D42B74|nr:hypothetical protein [Mycobacteroides abscessus]SLF47212.1 Uncharacterised protein [Mycobacteroides abscessus subsp. abscessus]
MTTKASWPTRLRAAARAFANPAGDESPPAVTPPDADVLAAWEPITSRGGVEHCAPRDFRLPES